ncbi:unnamed protein product [Triticum turgidum subsp. durum]|uniref:Uncharacterized protein n=1 Tax=Triticum turgidum subsp. durum TaxID=4567 RepID=A0A9R0RML8_TRITD|nr:unnamed protein product [Triticum turgidum subsp. durum]
MHRSKGKLSGVLSKGFKPDKCKIALKMAMARIKLLRNKKEVQVIEKLSAGAPDVQTKTKTLSSIAAEHNIKWEPKAFEEQKQNEDRMYGSTYSGGNIPTSGSSASSVPTPQPAAAPYSSVQPATSRVPAGPSYESSEAPANRNPHGTANSNASTQENRRGSDASVPPSFQHGAATYSSANIPGSNNYSNTGSSSVSGPHSQFGSTVPDPVSRTEEINRPRERKSSASGSNWNVEFKDAASAAQAAADSAEMASIAARAAAQLASRGNFYADQDTGAYESTAYMNDTTPRKQQAGRLMKDGKSFNEQISGINDPRMISSNAREDEERAETNHAPESRTDHDMPTEPHHAHSSEPPYFNDSSEPPYFDDSSEKESNIRRPEDHPFDLHEERLPDAGFDWHHTKDIGSRQASFDQESRNNHYSNFSASHGGSSMSWDNQNDKAGADSSAVLFDEFDYDVQEENLLDHFASKHTEELPTVQGHKGFSSADWSKQPRSESPVDRTTSTLFSRTETQPSYDLGANKEDIPLNDTRPPTFDSDGVSSDEETSTDMHILRTHSRGSDYSENKMFNKNSGEFVPDVNDSIEDHESRPSKQYQNPPGSDVFHKEQNSGGSPRYDYLGARGNLGRVQSRDYDLSEEETEPHKLEGTSSGMTGANENRPSPFRIPTSATSDDSDDGDVGLNYGRLTPGLRNKLRQGPQYKISGDNLLRKQSLEGAPASIEESVHFKENDTSSEQTGSRTTKNSFGANYHSEHLDGRHTVGKPVESRSSMTRDDLYSGDTGKLSERSGSPISSPTKTSVRENSIQEPHLERPGSGVRRESRSRTARTFFDSDESEEELERRRSGQTKLSKAQIQSRRTREVAPDTKRDGRARVGAQYAVEAESTPKSPAKAFSNSSTEQRKVAPAYSRVSVQQSLPNPVRIEPPAARGRWQEDEPDGSSSPENEGNTETSAETLKKTLVARFGRFKWDYDSLDDAVWEVRMHFHDRDNLERSICISDITYHNLVALIDIEGYGLNDYVYFVREPGVGIAGLEQISDDDKVDEMLDHIGNKDQNVVNLTVIRATDPRPADLNSGYVYEEQRQSEPLQFFSTQQSTNLDLARDQDELETLMELKRRTKIEKFRKHKEEVEHVQMVKQKLPILLAEDDSDLDADEDFLNMLNQLRRQREDPLLHFEGDTDVDEVYGEDEEEEQVEHEEEEQVEQQQEA